MAKGVTLGALVNVADGVPMTVAVRVGVRVGLGVLVLVAVLEGVGIFVGGKLVTTLVVPGVVVSTEMITMPAVPTLVGVGNLSSAESGGPKSQDASAKSKPRKAGATSATTRTAHKLLPDQSRSRNMALMITQQRGANRQSTDVRKEGTRTLEIIGDRVK